MTAGDLDPIVRSIIALAGGLGGLWFILRMAVAYQRDFTDRYAERVARQDDRIDKLEAEITALHRQTQECAAREARLRLVLIRAGIEVPPGS